MTSHDPRLPTISRAIALGLASASAIGVAALAAPAAAREAPLDEAAPVMAGAAERIGGETLSAPAIAPRRIRLVEEGEAEFDLAKSANADSASGAQPQSQGPTEGSSQGQRPPGMGQGKPVFDETWVTVGIGAGLVPSYAGSDDYIAFPLPLIVGRLGGVGINPNGPGITLNLLSQRTIPGQPGGTTFQFGPAFRIRNDRNARISDEVVEAAGKLDVAAEVGVNAGVSFPRVLNRFDSLTLSTQVRWDILGAHEGMLIEPNIGYTTPIGRATIVNLQASLQFVDDSFADYYYSVSPAQSAASGLPQYRADGGLNSAGFTAIVNYDLDGNALNGGFSVYGVAGYSRLFGDGKNTPYTAIRGNPDQLISGLGIAYTF